MWGNNTTTNDWNNNWDNGANSWNTGANANANANVTPNANANANANWSNNGTTDPWAPQAQQTDPWGTSNTSSWNNAQSDPWTSNTGDNGYWGEAPQNGFTDVDQGGNKHWAGNQGNHGHHGHHQEEHKYDTEDVSELKRIAESNLKGDPRNYKYTSEDKGDVVYHYYTQRVEDRHEKVVDRSRTVVPPEQAEPDVYSEKLSTRTYYDNHKDLRCALI